MLQAGGDGSGEQPPAATADTELHGELLRKIQGDLIVESGGPEGAASEVPEKKKKKKKRWQKVKSGGESRGEPVPTKAEAIPREARGHPFLDFAMRSAQVVALACP